MDSRSDRKENIVIKGIMMPEVIGMDKERVEWIKELINNKLGVR